jgi:hypothetical protein
MGDPPERAHATGIRQLPAGAFQVRFQHLRTSYVTTYPTHELAEEAEPLLRAAVLSGQHAEHDTVDIDVPPPTKPTPGSRPAPTPEQVPASSAAAAQLMDEILAGSCATLSTECRNQTRC